MDPNFAITEMRLRSRRANIERRIGRALWAAENDPMADLGALGDLVTKLESQAAILTQRIGAHVEASERRALRKELLSY